MGDGEGEEMLLLALSPWRASTLRDEDVDEPVLVGVW